MADLKCSTLPQYSSTPSGTMPVLPLANATESSNQLSEAATRSDESTLKGKGDLEEVLPERRGWGRWLAEDISTCSLVPTLVLQAFATG
jgi:hypothetical protein